MSRKQRISLLKKFFLNTKALYPYFIIKLKREKSVDSKIVFVLSFPRSGTHALGSLIANDSVGVHYYSEFFIFNGWNSMIEKINRYYPYFSWRYSRNSAQQKRAWKYLKFETTSLDAHKTLRALKRIPGTHIIKIFPLHFSNALLESLITEFHPHIVFLRRNHLDRYVSHKKANATGVWHRSATSDIEIEINQAEFDKYISDFTNFYTHFKKFTVDSGCHVMDLAFAQLHTTDDVRALQRFVAPEGFTKWDQLPPAPTTFRQERTNAVQAKYLEECGKVASDFDFPKVGA